MSVEIDPRTRQQMRDLIRATERVTLLTGETCLVSPLGAGRWLVTVDAEPAREFRHDAATGESSCECGAVLSCLHRTAVWQVSERRVSR